ncbi:hypothetical protein [Streptomyces sp. enrichment culture]|uniref:hypothetical protein n=1 Tax=Streptomyces sp. enrichment culture TaxID=1795815 RepID=UPI003F55D94E
MAQSEIPVALIGLGGAIAGAAATVVVGRLTGRHSVQAALVAKVDGLQDELTAFCAPFVEARVQLSPGRAAQAAVRELYQDTKDLIETYTQEFKRLAKRGMGVL